jgi:hypothetical protein
MKRRVLDGSVVPSCQKINFRNNVSLMERGIFSNKE